LGLKLLNATHEFIREAYHFVAVFSMKLLEGQPMHGAGQLFAEGHSVGLLL
jgi:hypothetical protein